MWDECLVSVQSQRHVIVAASAEIGRSSCPDWDITNKLTVHQRGGGSLNFFNEPWFRVF